jgi:serine protease inhibitor
MRTASIRSFLWVALAAAVPTISGCRKTDSSSANSSEVKSTVEGNTTFALDLYKRLGNQPGNLFFSPYSLSTALAMTYSGARGTTESEMARTLHFSQSQNDVHAAFATLTARLHEVEGRNRITLAVANSLWCQQSYRFTDAFLNLTRARYQAEVRLVDFEKAAEAARGEINTWVERKTKERIKNLIGPDQLAADARLVLCNAIYFKGKWAIQFDPRHTRPEPFFRSPGESSAGPTMWQTSDFKSTDADKVSLLELRYSGDDLSMIILLPQAVDGLSELQGQLSTENLHRWTAKLEQTHADKLSVSLPRFKTTQSFGLAKELAAMGMPSAFAGAADFSGMTGTDDLFLSDVVHKAFVEVNEEGTEAAAATGAEAYMKGESSAKWFKVDHPFIFLIRENRTGSILFLGRVVDPSK